MPKYFLFEKDDAVTTITFNRPDKRNCLDDDVVLELESLVQRVRDDRDTRVLIATGTGKAFSAGADVSGAKGIADPRERARAAGRSAARFPRLIGRVVDLISHLDIMTIAAVNGYAIGGGWSIALAFDFCIAVEGAEFWVPEVDMGVPYRGTPAQILALRMGPWAAKEATILCRHYKAEELLAMRVINRIVKPEELMAAARAVAAALAAKPASAVAPSKRDINAIFYGERLY
jgi:enoyl-CoA hydratase/carnithine racemase